MARADAEARTLTLTVVVFGAARAGKSALLRAIHDRVTAEHRGSEEPLSKSGAPGFPLDWVSLDLGQVAGWQTRVHLYAIPPQEHADATRRLVLAQADGVLFVADAQASRFEANREAITALRSQLLDDDGAPRILPTVLVVSKHDLPEELRIDASVIAVALSVEELPSFACDLVRGEGVFRALQAVIGASMRQIIAPSGGEAAP